MIEKDARLSIQRIPLDRLLTSETVSCFPVKFQIYLDLLTNHPEQDVEPIIVTPHTTYQGLYSIRNGKHRFISSILAGRKDILGIIVEEAHAA